MFVAPGDHESKPDASSVPDVASSSFYLIQTDDNGQTSSAAGGDVSITQVLGDEMSNVTEPKTNDNESFYFVDDKSADSKEPELPAASQLPADTETEEEQHPLDEQSEDEKVETAVKAPTIETPPPVPSSASINDPDSLLTSVRLVIGAFFVVYLYSYKPALWCTLRRLLYSHFRGLSQLAMVPVLSEETSRALALLV